MGGGTEKRKQALLIFSFLKNILLLLKINFFLFLLLLLLLCPLYKLPLHDLGGLSNGPTHKLQATSRPEIFKTHSAKIQLCWVTSKPPNVEVQHNKTQCHSVHLPLYFFFPYLCILIQVDFPHSPQHEGLDPSAKPSSGPCFCPEETHVVASQVSLPTTWFIVPANPRKRTVSSARQTELQEDKLSVNVRPCKVPL